MLVTPFLRFPFVCEYGIEDSSKLSSSFRQIGCDKVPDKQANKSLLVLTVISLLQDLTPTLFALLNLGS